MNSSHIEPPDGVHSSLSAIEIEASLRALPGWTVTPGGGTSVIVPAIEKHWRLPDFAQTMALANAVAALAKRLDHHPELHIGDGRCGVRWTTHDAGGVTARDLHAAGQTDALAERLGAGPESPT